MHGQSRIYFHEGIILSRSTLHECFFLEKLPSGSARWKRIAEEGFRLTCSRTSAMAGIHSLESPRVRCLGESGCRLCRQNCSFRLPVTLNAAWLCCNALRGSKPFAARNVRMGDLLGNRVHTVCRAKLQNLQQNANRITGDTHTKGCVRTEDEALSRTIHHPRLR